MARAVIKVEDQLKRLDALRLKAEAFKTAGDTMLKRPEEKKWSGIEVVKHMYIAYAAYIPKIEGALSKLPESEKVEKIVARAIPSFLINRFPPNDGKIRFKMKTFGKFKPLVNPNSLSEEEAQRIYEQFSESLNKLTEWTHAYRTKDVKAVRFNSAAGASVRFNVAEAVEFIIAHNERHCQQIENTLKKVG